MSGYILSSIPLWVYVTVGLLIVGVLFYFFSPLFIGLWKITPNWLKYIIGGIIALFSMFVYGRHKGYKDVKAHDEELNKRAVENRRKIHDDVQKLNPADTDKRLDRWMRD